MPQELPIDMSLPERIAATEVTVQIFALGNLAMQLTPDQVALAVKLHDEIAKTEIIGRARDISETHGRIIRAFAAWHARLVATAPAMREIAAQPPITEDDVRFMGKDTD